MSKFQRVEVENNWGTRPKVGTRTFKRDEKVMVRWPDGHTSTHQLRVRNVTGGSLMREESSTIVTFEVEVHGAKVEVNLDEQFEVRFLSNG